jgi:hypothetical protein
MEAPILAMTTTRRKPMNWIFETYATVYQTVTGLDRCCNGDIALAKKQLERDDAKTPRR